MVGFMITRDEEHGSKLLELLRQKSYAVVLVHHDVTNVTK